MEAAVRDALRVFDSTEAGRVQADQLVSILSEQHIGVPLGRPQAVALVERFQIDEDGTISIDELVQAFSSTAALQHTLSDERQRLGNWVRAKLAALPSQPHLQKLLSEIESTGEDGARIVESAVAQAEHVQNCFKILLICANFDARVTQDLTFGINHRPVSLPE